MALNIPPTLPPLVSEAITALDSFANRLVGSLPPGIPTRREELLNALPAELKSQMLVVQDYLNETIGDTFAAATTGLLAGALLVFINSNKVLGFAAGSIGTSYEAGRQGANQLNPVSVLDPQTLAQLFITRRISDDAFFKEMLRNGYDANRALGYANAQASILGVPDALHALQRGHISEQAARDYLSFHGIYGQDQNVLIKNTENTLSLLEYVQAWNRGDLNDQAFDTKCQHIGIVGEELAIVKKLAKVIPGPPDLVRMAVREAFSEEQAQLLDLDAEFPAPFAEWTEKQGLSEEWAKRYWRAHWELPSPTQAFEMFHRTTFTPSEPGQQPSGTEGGRPYYTVISQSQLEALIKAQDYAPTWREKLLAISYNTLTRVDVRRMYGLGIIDADGVKRAYLDIGYNDENASRLASFTIAEEQESNLGVIKARMLLLYRRGIVNREQLSQFLLSLKIPQAIVDVIINAEDMLAAAEDIDRHLAAIRAQYFASVLREDQLIVRLTALGLQAVAITRIVSIWIDEKAAKVSRLTVVNLQKAFKQGILTEEEFRQDLRERRLPEFDIDVMVKLHGPIEEQPEPSPEP